MGEHYLFALFIEVMALRGLLDSISPFGGTCHILIFWMKENAQHPFCAESVIALGLLLLKGRLIASPVMYVHRSNSIVKWLLNRLKWGFPFIFKG